MAMLAIALSLCGCSQSSTQLGLDTASPNQSGLQQPAQVGADNIPVHRLAPADKVRVTVFNEPTLSGEFVVDSRGKLSYPLVGEIDAKGLTGPELERAVAGKLKGRFLVNPQVSLEVLSVRPVYVIGEVRSPGEYPFRNGLNIVSAIALAGGFAPRADMTTVYVKRLSDSQEQRHSDLANLWVQPGDIIRVGERYF
jgi:polysaccharide export outer membrane protein